MDTDEYISYNVFPRDPTNTGLRPCRNVRLDNLPCRDDGFPVEMMRYFGLEFPPRLGDPESTIAHFIGKHWNDTVYNARHMSRICDVMPRLQIGAKETGPHGQTLPEDFDCREFRTLRYRQPGEERNALPGKAIMNLQNWKTVGRRLTPHRGPGYCFNADKRSVPDASLSFFRVNHYSGSLEEFLSRSSDGKRSVDLFMKRNAYSVSGQSDEVVGWLKSFIQRVSPHRALYLTQGLRKWAFKNDAKLVDAHRGANTTSEQV